MDVKESATVCQTCEGERWVCENHPDRSWPDECECGAGMPCKECNDPPEGTFPAYPPGSTVIWSIWSDDKAIN